MPRAASPEKPLLLGLARDAGIRTSHLAYNQSLAPGIHPFPMNIHAPRTSKSSDSQKAICWWRPEGERRNITAYEKNTLDHPQSIPYGKCAIKLERISTGSQQMNAFIFGAKFKSALPPRSWVNGAKEKSESCVIRTKHPFGMTCSMKLEFLLASISTLSQKLFFSGTISGTTCSGTWFLFFWYSYSSRRAYAARLHIIRAIIG